MIEHDSCKGCVFEEEIQCPRCNMCRETSISGSEEYLSKPDLYIDFEKMNNLLYCWNVDGGNKRVQILREAESIICGERQDMYGSPEHSLATIAKYWSVYKGVEFTAMDAAMMLALMKFARQQNKPKHDNLVDAIGYIACAAELE